MWIYVLLLYLYHPRPLLRNRSFLLMMAAPSGQTKSVMCYKYEPDCARVPSEEEELVFSIQPWLSPTGTTPRYYWASTSVNGSNLHPGGSRTLRSAPNDSWSALTLFSIRNQAQQYLVLSQYLFLQLLTPSILHPVSCQPVPVGPIRLVSP